MNESHKSYQLQLVFMLVIVTFSSMACFFFQPTIGNVFSNIYPDLSAGTGTITPETVAKTWVEALFRADGDTLRAATCESQRSTITDEILKSVSEAFSMGGATIKLDNVTYTFDEATSTLTVGGTMEIIVSGVSQEIPASMFPPFPMVQENGTWLVCAPLDE